MTKSRRVTNSGLSPLFVSIVLTAGLVPPRARERNRSLESTGGHNVNLPGNLGASGKPRPIQVASFFAERMTLRSKK
jgi:hypothetical protein